MVRAADPLLALQSWTQRLAETGSPARDKTTTPLGKVMLDTETSCSDSTSASEWPVACLRLNELASTKLAQKMMALFIMDLVRVSRLLLIIMI
jgi:hypothetical protein